MAPRQAIEEQLDKILKSKGFSGSERMRRFLAYTVSETLDGNRENLKEYSIGVEVFDRDAAYDPRVDSIVRVEARRLRSKLKTYYAGEGKGDPIRITFSAGSYVPAFEGDTIAGPAAAPPPVPPPAPSPDNRPSIAVLPFASLSTDPNHEHFADGLTDELIHTLSRLDQLRVVARTSTLQYKHEPRDVRAIGAALGATAILEGSVRREGSQLRVNAQLIDAVTGYELWSGQYDRDSTAIFTIQEDLARAIAQRLRIRLASAPGPAIQTIPLDAYQFYLEGRYFASRATPQNARRAIESFTRALMIEPRFAAAHAGMAGCYAKSMLAVDQNPIDLAPLARGAVTEALRLDPQSAPAYCWLGFLRAIYDWDWPAAEADFLKALELSPSYADAAIWYGAIVLCPLGRFAEARHQFQKALLLDPASLVAHASNGMVSYLMGDAESALQHLRHSLDLDPGFYGGRRLLASVLLSTGEFEEAVKLLESAVLTPEIDPRNRAALGFTLGYAGREAEALKIASDLEFESKSRYISPYDRALVQQGLAYGEKACDLLAQAAAERCPWLAMLNVDPVFDELRSRPDFQAIVHRVFATSTTGAATS